MIQAKPRSMKPNITGLNQTGFGASSFDEFSERAGLLDFFFASDIATILLVRLNVS
jgi:hypothetical protein